MKATLAINGLTASCNTSLEIVKLRPNFLQYSNYVVKASNKLSFTCKANNENIKTTDVVLVCLLLTLNIFHILPILNNEIPAGYKAFIFFQNSAKGDEK